MWLRYVFQKGGYMLGVRSKIIITMLVMAMFVVGPASSIGQMGLAGAFVLLVWFFPWTN